MNINKMVNENYTNPSEIGNRASDYSGVSDLENTAVKPRKKTSALTKLVVGGIVAGGLVVGGNAYVKWTNELSRIGTCNNAPSIEEFGDVGKDLLSILVFGKPLDESKHEKNEDGSYNLSYKPKK
jgi:hypothetical protein